MFVSRLPSIFRSFIPHTKSPIPMSRKSITKSIKVVIDTGKLILIFSHFHVAKIVSITQNINGYVKMMQSPYA